MALQVRLLTDVVGVGAAGTTQSVENAFAADLVFSNRADRVGAGWDSYGSGDVEAIGDTGAYSIKGPDGALIALSEATTESLATASATTQILTGPGEYFAYRCTVAAGNITVYDNTASSGKVLVPTTALAVGTFPIYGAGIGRSVIVDNGIRVVLSGAATVYIGHMGY